MMIFIGIVLDLSLSLNLYFILLLFKLKSLSNKIMKLVKEFEIEMVDFAKEYNIDAAEIKHNDRLRKIFKDGEK